MKKIFLKFVIMFGMMLFSFPALANNIPQVNSIDTPEYVNSFNKSNFPVFIKGIEDVDLNQNLSIQYNVNSNGWSEVGIMQTPLTDYGIFFEINLNSYPEGNLNLSFKITDGIGEKIINKTLIKKTISPLNLTSFFINNGGLFTNSSIVNLELNHPNETDVSEWCITEDNDFNSCTWVKVKPTTYTIGSPLVGSCNSQRPFCELFGGCTISEGTPLIPNQSWVNNSGTCGFTCNEGYSGDKCQNYTGKSCNGLPSCVGEGTCDNLVFNPTIPNQSWVNNSGTCGFTCNEGYIPSGTSCIPNKVTVSSIDFNGKTYTYTPFELHYNSPLSVLSSNPYPIANGSISLTATFTLESNGNITLSNTNETITCDSDSNLVGDQCISTLPQSIGDIKPKTFNINGINYTYNLKRLPDNKVWTINYMRHPVDNCNNNSRYNSSSELAGEYFDFNRCSGVFYQRTVSQKVCGELGSGWRLPTITEFDDLVGRFPSGSPKYGHESTSVGWGGNKLHGLLSGLPGFIGNNGSHYSNGFGVELITSNISEYRGSYPGYYHILRADTTQLFRETSGKAEAVSVVCVKD